MERSLKRLSDSTAIMIISLPENSSSTFSIVSTIGWFLGSMDLKLGSISRLKIFQPRTTVIKKTTAIIVRGYRASRLKSQFEIVLRFIVLKIINLRVSIKEKYPF